MDENEIEKLKKEAKEVWSDWKLIFKSVLYVALFMISIAFIIGVIQIL